MTFRKFDSIEAFKHAIKNVRDYANRHSVPVPTLKFKGTVKLHGTNAGIGYFPKTDTFTVQSRERILTINSDNFGFAMWVSGSAQIKKLMDTYAEQYPFAESIYIYGEWAGPGIQKGVGISGIPEKSFFVFDVVVDGESMFYKPLDFVSGNRVYFITDFPSWEIEIDFNRPELSQNQLVDITLAVEAECPVAKALGVSGIGEGVVWKNNETGVIFKVKGEKHSSTKVQTVKQIAETDITLYNAMNDFVDAVCSESRLQQGITKLSEMGLDTSAKNTGAYIKWVVQDVLKEEEAEIVKNQFEWKKVSGLITSKARNFFVNYTE